MQSDEPLERCVYCGLIAEARDHVIPIAYKQEYKRKGHEFEGEEDNLVPACNECNGIASSHVFDSFEEKKAYIQGALEQKYWRILSFKDWRESEMDEMSSKFRKILRLRMLAKKVINNRLNYPEVKYNEFKDSREMWELLANLLRYDPE